MENEKPKETQRKERVAYGIAAITRAFHGVDFPGDKQTLLASIKGRETVHWAKDHTVDLKELLESLPYDPIRSITELTHLINERLHPRATA